MYPTVSGIFEYGMPSDGLKLKIFEVLDVQKRPPILMEAKGFRPDPS